MDRWTKIIVAFGLIFLMGAFFNTDQEVLAREEKVIVHGDVNAVTNLDPASTSLGPATMLFRNLFQGLLRYKFNSTELEGDLAKSWTLSQDGLVYTLKLRDNIIWHKDFGKVLAPDVKFSFDRVMDPQTRSPFAGEVSAAVKEVKVVDQDTVEIHLKAPSAVFLHYLARPKPVAIVSKKAWEKHGKEFSRNPIGSGPFVFQSMSREEIVLTANLDYYEGPPKIDKLIFKTIPDIDSLIMALQKGDVDMAWILPRDKPILDRLQASGCNIKVINRGAGNVLFLNPQIKPLADVRVRRAIAHALDRDSLIEHGLSGMAEKLSSPVAKGYFGHTEEGLRRYDYDPKKAKELLAEAGYPNGFEVTLDTYASPTYTPVVTILQSQLAKVGIKANLETTDVTSWMKKVSNATAQMCPYLAVRSPDADIPLTQFFHSAGFSPGYNMMRYNKLDKEIDAARRELDEAKRRKMYQAIQKQLMEDLPAIPLFMMNYPVACRSHIAGLPEDRDPIHGLYFYPMHFVGKK